MRAAEQAANERLSARAGNVANAVPWYGDPTGEQVSGTLTRVDCLNDSMRLTIQTSTGGSVRLLIRDPRKITVNSALSAQAEFVCGVQKPARRIEVKHNAKADDKMGTVGDILVVAFR